VLGWDLSYYTPYRDKPMNDLSLKQEALSLDERRALFGKQLRNIRQTKGFSVEDVVHLTRITITFIEAMEIGRLDILPGRVFGRGFLKNICKAINADCTDVLMAYDACWQEDPSSPIKKKFYVTWPKKTGWLLPTGTLLFCLVGAWFWKSLEPSDPSPSLQTPIDVVWVEIPHLYPQFSLDQKSSDEILANLGIQIYGVTPVDKILPTEASLGLTIHQSVKLISQIDNEPSQEKIWEPGQHRITFKEKAEIFISDTEALELMYDGKKIGHLGQYGKQRTLRFFNRRL
jgi:hypothetical protein